LNTHVTERGPETDAIPETEGAMVDEVYRRLVRAQSAIVTRTNSDTEVIP